MFTILLYYILKLVCWHANICQIALNTYLIIKYWANVIFDLMMVLNEK